MPRQKPFSNATPHREHGLSLLELLVTLFLLSLFVGVLVTGITVYQKYRVRVATQKRLQELTYGLTATLKNDIETAGLMSKPEERLVVKEGSVGRPAVYLSTDNQSLMVIGTNLATTGRVVQVSGSTVILNGIDPDVWKGLLAGTVVLISGGGQPPTLFRLTEAPRNPTPSELIIAGGSPISVPDPGDSGSGPGRETRIPDRPGGGTGGGGLGQVAGTILIPDRTVVLTGTANAACDGFASLGSTVTAAMSAVPVTTIIHYDFGNGQILRTERSLCTSQGDTSQTQTDYSSPLSIELSLRYVSDTGESVALPVNLATLRGIAVHGKLSDRNLKLTEGFDFTAYVHEWKP
ncbi:MAG: prepilin-type N-terminal cleavage/methylation domain-containing protein [Acidobacteria bacterium]|nr:prepilin-type N-terminal cleavage/methylation domain-containing protein [Acidobacteriota bacterium]